MEKPDILLISGKIFSGKDFTADILVKNYKWKKMSFADDLKTLCSKKYNIDINDLYSHSGKSKKYDEKRTVRDILIQESLKCKKDNINFFVDRIVNKINEIGTCNIVIPDFRYPNEYYRIVELLSHKFNITTCNVLRETSVKNNDKSENSLNDFNFHFKIYNDNGEERVISQLLSFFL